MSTETTNPFAFLFDREAQERFIATAQGELDQIRSILEDEDEDPAIALPNHIFLPGASFLGGESADDRSLAFTGAPAIDMVRQLVRDNWVHNVPEDGGEPEELVEWVTDPIQQMLDEARQALGITR